MATVTYEEIKDLPNHPEKLLIDVRNVDEVQATGQIPTSINIPLPNVKEELELSAEDFKSKYGRNKSLENEIIFHCYAGRRAANASAVAEGLGFTNSKSYPGSWTEWALKEGL
ncbi:hypothetical protein HA402_007955 [Bradysia odoriphaga]|nr:hypothetical protein HA402_007955 [Bradysia odoriphaga]